MKDSIYGASQYLDDDIGPRLQVVNVARHLEAVGFDLLSDEDVVRFLVR